MSKLSEYIINAGDADYVEKHNKLVHYVNNLEVQIGLISALPLPIMHLFAEDYVIETTNGETVITRDGEATYFDGYGLLKTAAIDELRVSNKGALIEAFESENLILNNTVLGYNAWAKHSSNTFTVESSTLRCNGEPGALLVTNTGTSVYRIHNTYHLTQYEANDIVSISCVVKSGTGGAVRFRAFGDGGDFKGDLIYYIDSKTFSSGAGSFSNKPKGIIEELPNGWCRVFCQFTSTLDISDLGIEFYSVNQDGIPNQSFYIDFMQVENLPFPSSIIINEGSKKTRSADVIKAPIYNNLPPATDNWAISAEINLPSVTETSPFSRIFDVDNDKSFEMILDDEKLKFNFGRSPITSLESPVITENELIKFFIVHDSGTLYFYVNGVLIDSDEIANYPTLDPSGFIYFFRRSIGGGASVGHIKNFKTFKTTVSAEQVAETHS